ncbi:MAG: heparin lyase I family protein [Myxococcota bacterium]
MNGNRTPSTLPKHVRPVRAVSLQHVPPLTRSEEPFVWRGAASDFNLMRWTNEVLLRAAPPTLEVRRSPRPLFGPLFKEDRPLFGQPGVVKVDPAEKVLLPLQELLSHIERTGPPFHYFNEDVLEQFPSLSDDIAELGPYVSTPEHCLVSLWLGQPDTSPPVAVQFYSDRHPKLVTKDDYGSITAPSFRYNVRWTDPGTVTNGTWFNYLVKIKWGAGNGELKLWKWESGQWKLKYDSYTDTIVTAPNYIGYHDAGMDQTNYTWKLGGYRAQNDPAKYVMYFDEIRYAKTWDSVIVNEKHAPGADELGDFVLRSEAETLEDAELEDAAATETVGY